MYSTVFAFTLQAYLWKNLVLLLFWSALVNQHNVNKRQCDSGWHFWNQTEITSGGLKDVNSKWNHRPELDPKETWIQVYHILHTTMWKQTVLNPLLLVQLQFLSIEKKKGGSLFYLCSHPKIFETGCGSGFSPRSTKSVQYKVNLGDTSEAKPN